MPYPLRSRVSLALVRRQLPGLMTADPAGDLPDGLHVAIVGSGSPLPDVKRRNPCAAVIVDGKIFLVDAGEGASETMARMQLDPGRVKAVLMTHFHSDHIGGLGTVNLQRWVADGDRPALPVIGPPGTERVVDGLNEAYALDRGYRVDHHGPDLVDPQTGAMDAQVFSIPEGQDSMVVLEDGDLKVTAFVVQHPPIEPALGYRFDYRGRSAVISGDTNYSPTLIEAAQGANLLVHDALSTELLMMVSEAARDAGLSTRGQILADVPDYHATAPEAADAAREAGVGALAITHIVPPLPLKGLEAIFLADAEERFDGPLWLARDGDLYSLPTGTDQLDRSNLIRRR
ncbi:MAG: MBL fold metallo-hydrolase [Solirubrobacterales bacterium]